MSKIIGFMLCLFVAFPVIGMELQVIEKKKKRETAHLIITAEENQKFASELANKLSFCKTVTANSMYVPQDNPIYKMIEGLSRNFKECNSSVFELIISQSLAERINNYKKVCDSEKVVKFCLQQIYKKEGDVNAARNVAVTNRQLIAEMKLNTLQLHYSYQYLEATQIQDKIEYMKRNSNYPMNEEAVKDFIALLIYQIIFAHQTHKK